MRNMVRDGDTGSLGQKWQQIRAQETLERAVEASSWGQPKPSPNFGRGVAMYERGAATGRSSALITVDADGIVTVDIGTPETGPGIDTVVQQVVAEGLGVPSGSVRVRADTTDSVPFDAGVGGSKSTNSTGHAAHRAALEARELLAGAAAGILGCPLSELRQEEGRFVGPGGSVGIGQAAQSAAPAGGAFSHLFLYEPPGQAPVTSFCAQIAEVEVDAETGRVDVKRIITAHDVGTVINQVGHQGQIDGGVIQGLGYALMEETPLVDGRVSTAHLGDFKLPSAPDVPQLETVLLDSVVSGPTPFDGKAIGEIPNVPTAAAIVNAIHDATGVRLYDLPVSSEKLLQSNPG
jgi:xanthine dehydrogenase molybdenum-binding subunit